MSLLVEMYGENNIQPAISDGWLRFKGISDVLSYALPKSINKIFGDYEPMLIPDHERLLQIDSHPTSY